MAADADNPAWPPPSGDAADAPEEPSRGVHRGVVVAIAAAVLAVVVGGAFALRSGGDDDVIARAEAETTTTRARPTTSIRAETSSTIAPTTSERANDPVDTTTPAATTTSSSSTTTTTGPPATAPPLPEEPAVVARPTPVEPPPPPPEAPPAPWADSVFTTAGGHVSTDVGCAADLSAASLEAFFAERIGPVLGWDYQHVYDLGGGRYLWLFQDTFIDHSNTAQTLAAASFVHNTALVQDGRCFRLLHRGSPDAPQPFELGTGANTLRTWFWPMGGEVHDGRLYVFWARMIKDAVDPVPPDGLGWHPNATFVATYDPVSMQRLDFRLSTQSGASPI